MAAIRNSLDLALQNTNPRILPVGLPENVTVDPGQVGGLPEYLSNAKAVYLSYPSQVFQLAKSGAVSPSGINITATLKNIVGNVVWSVAAGSANLTTSPTTPSVALIQQSNMYSDSVTIRASVTVSSTATDGTVTTKVYYDEVTVVKLREGNDSISSFLTNESHTLQASTTGVVASFAGAVTGMKIYVGFTDDSANWSYTGAPSSGVSASTTPGGVCTITAMSATSGYVDITAKKPGWTDITKRFTLSKSIAGTNGTNGTNGSNGSNGANGPRGTVNISYAISGASWSYAEAAAAISSAGYGVAQNRDMVTLFNTGAGYSETRFYDNGSWLSIAAYVNGNMIVTGTFSADKITTGTLTGVDINIAQGYFRVQSNGNATAAFLVGARIAYDNISSPVAPTAQFSAAVGSSPALKVTASSDAAAAEITAGGTSLNSHGLRAKTAQYNASGIVGCSNGKAFHAEFGTAGPFTGSHDVAILNGTDIEPGDIVIDTECLIRGDWANTFFHVMRSSEAKQKAALGVYTRTINKLSRYNMLPSLEEQTVVDDFGDVRGDKLDFLRTYADDFFVGEVNAVGEGQMNVCGLGGDIEAGDLICTSSMAGKGMKQDDDLVHGYTVARARESVTFSEDEEVRQVACIYMCG